MNRIAFWLGFYQPEIKKAAGCFIRKARTNVRNRRHG